MATSVFMKADEVQELLGVSRSEAYRIMKSGGARHGVHGERYD